MTCSHVIPVRHDVGAAIAARALACVGTPFRLHGRRAECGLDCVGLVGAALSGTERLFDIPCDYTLRGDHLERVSAFFGDSDFRPVNGTAKAGDILLCRPAPRQLHFAILTDEGLVHAHAGLRRIVLTPPPLPWPIVSQWRYIGD